MRIRHLILAAIMFAVPSTAQASWNLSGFLGPVTLTTFGGCHYYLCVNATLASGNSAVSGAWFTQVLHMDTWFELSEGVTNPRIRFAGFSYTDFETGADGPDYMRIIGESGTFASTDSPFFDKYLPSTLDFDYAVSIEEADGLVMESDWAATFSPVRVTVTPEPGTLLLLGTGVGALAAARRRRKRASE
jgi:hypothetical protein